MTGTTLGLIRERAARRSADEATTRETALRIDATHRAYDTSIASADAAMEDADGIRFWRSMRACPASEIGWEWHFLEHLATAGIVPLTTIPSTPEQVRMAEADENRWFWEWDTSVASPLARQWDLDTGRSMRTVPGLTGRFDRLLRRLAIVNSDGSIDVRDGATAGLIVHSVDRYRDGKIAFGAHAFSPDGRFVVALDVAAGKLVFFDTTTGHLDLVQMQNPVACRSANFVPAPIDPQRHRSGVVFIQTRDPGSQIVPWTIDPITHEAGPPPFPIVAEYLYVNGEPPADFSMDLLKGPLGGGLLVSAFLHDPERYITDLDRAGRLDINPLPPRTVPAPRRIMGARLRRGLVHPHARRPSGHPAIRRQAIVLRSIDRPRHRRVSRAWVHGPGFVSGRFPRNQHYLGDMCSASTP